MAEMTIRLQTDPVTGRKNIIVGLRSDEDMLPHEHEQQHRALVDKLIEGGVLSAAQVGKVIVQREAGTGVDQVAEEPMGQAERNSVDQSL
ncbi:MAG: hypothetical protein JNM43_29440 [Planctomycetaceae bacterium]|nr:hypothetical protein [Planctomycetaceae bacterium]